MSRGEAQAAYNCVVALQDVSFDVYDGETFVVMGLSGSGKSTIVRCINRLINPTTGSVFVDDDDVLAFGDEELTNFRENSDVLPLGSVAVAVMNLPTGMSDARVTPKLALPLPSVAVVATARNVSPSP